MKNIFLEIEVFSNEIRKELYEINRSLIKQNTGLKVVFSKYII